MNRLVQAMALVAFLASPLTARAADEPAPSPPASASEVPPRAATVSEVQEPTAPQTEAREADEGAQAEAAASPSAVQTAPAPSTQDADPDEPDLTSDTDPSALTDFRDELEPYGSWVEDPTYGLVWVPHSSVVGADFAPYVTSGHWALTASGQWIWVSHHPFGWVVYHYGRWVYVPGLGWSWVPGRQYAPAWVVFRTSLHGDPYLGWAPLPPRYVWIGGRAVWLRRVPPTPYVFCPSRYVFHTGLDTWVLRDRIHTRALVQRSRPYVRSRPTIRVGPSAREAGVEVGSAQRVKRITRAVPLRQKLTQPARALTPLERERTKPERAKPERAKPRPPPLPPKARHERERTKPERAKPERAKPRPAPLRLPPKARPKPPPPPPPKASPPPRKKAPRTAAPLKPFPRPDRVLPQRGPRRR